MAVPVNAKYTMDRTYEQQECLKGNRNYNKVSIYNQKATVEIFGYVMGERGLGEFNI